MSARELTNGRKRVLGSSRLAAMLVCATALVPAARGADPQPYTVRTVPSGQADLDAAISASSMLVSLQKTQAVGPFALAGRIRADYGRVADALHSQGYYDGQAKLSVSAVDAKGRDQGATKLDGLSPNLPGWLGALPKGDVARVSISVVTGPLYHIGRITLEDAAKGPDGKSQTTPITLSPAQDAAFALKPDQAARAADVLAAQGRLAAELKEEGHALSTVAAPDAYLHPNDKTLDLVFHVHLGPVVEIGPIELGPSGHVRASFIRRMLTIREGQLWRPSDIESARQILAGQGVFSDVGVKEMPPPVPLATLGLPPVGDATEALPLRFSFQEAKRHTVSAQLGYSTDLGGRAGVSWIHHNLFGAAERLTLTALVTGLGGTAQQGLGYDVYADLLKPDWLRRDQNLAFRIEGIRQLLYSYRQTALLVRGGVTRKIGKYWNASVALSAEQERIQQFGLSRSYLIASIPLGVTYDSTELANPILPATHGVRFSGTVTPSESLEHTESFFTLLSATASTYFDLHRLGLTAPGRSVIAVRGTVGSVQGASTYQIPPDQRLYAGGPATIRGFRYQGVGPQFPGTKYAIGGTSLDAGSVEFRQRIGKSFGAAGFMDAGQVASNSAPFEGKLRVGVGGGVRYFTPIGPVRLDVAVPVNKPPRGDRFELYIGLGETF